MNEFYLIYIALTLLTSTTEGVYGIFDTVPGGVAYPAIQIIFITPGHYSSSESPSNAFDQNTATQYSNSGSCYLAGNNDISCGTGSGIYMVPDRGTTLLRSLRFSTGTSAAASDPLTVVVEGSNAGLSELLIGSSWTTIYNGTTGLDTDPGRSTYGVTQYISNSNWYTSYRIIITSKRASSCCVIYGEIEMMGY